MESSLLQEEERNEPKWITEKAAEKGRRRVGLSVIHVHGSERTDDDDVGLLLYIAELRTVSHPLSGAGVPLIRFLLYFSIMYPLDGRGHWWSPPQQYNPILPPLHIVLAGLCPTVQQRGRLQIKSGKLIGKFFIKFWQVGTDDMATAQNGLIIVQWRVINWWVH